MDRNTLLAFFLIALVLLFTPKYMEIFSPQKPATKNEPVNLVSENQPDSLINPKSLFVHSSKQESFLPLNKKNNKQVTMEFHIEK